MTRARSRRALPPSARGASRAGALVVLLACGLVACDESQVWRMPHLNLARMESQKRTTPFGETDAFPDGRTMRNPPAGAVAYRAVPASDGARPGGGWIERIPIPVTRELVERGRTEFDTTCAVCHGVLGDGNSVVAEKMELRKPRSLQEPAVRDYPVGRLYQIATRGYGLMPAYDRIIEREEDRWAVVAYVKALQLSRNAPVADLPPDLRAQLARTP